MKVGDKVTRYPQTLCESVDGERKGSIRAMRGRVVYVHLRGRFHTVEFETRGGPVRESFLGVEG